MPGTKCLGMSVFCKWEERGYFRHVKHMSILLERGRAGGRGEREGEEGEGREEGWEREGGERVL